MGKPKPITNAGHTVEFVRHPEDTSRPATQWDAVCGCGKWKTSWGDLGDVRKQARAHVGLPEQ